MDIPVSRYNALLGSQLAGATANVSQVFLPNPGLDLEEGYGIRVCTDIKLRGWLFLRWSALLSGLPLQTTKRQYCLTHTVHGALMMCEDETATSNHSRVMAYLEEAAICPYCPTDSLICILR